MPSKKTTRNRTKAKPVQKQSEVSNNEETPKDEAVQAKAPVQESPATASPELPQHLKDKMARTQQAVEDLKKEIEEFKAHPTFMSGDIPVTLHGLQGDSLGRYPRSLNYIDKSWIDPNIHIHWSHKTMVNYHRGEGYEPFDYEQFQAMVTSRGGPELNFQRSTEKHVQLGDLILIKTSRQWYDELCERHRKKVKTREARATSNLYQKGRELGVEVYEGDMGGPKMQRILEFITKELGPQATRALLGQ
jgi:hypothetical protein